MIHLYIPGISFEINIFYLIIRLNFNFHFNILFDNSSKVSQLKLFKVELVCIASFIHSSVRGGGKGLNSDERD